jgi:hypothetical protein
MSTDVQSRESTGEPSASRRLIATRLEFHDALHEAFAEMASTGCREVWMSDEDFADWPLNAPRVIDALTGWAQSQRKLTLVARHYDEVVRRHSRWIAWRRQWSHVVECLACDDAEVGDIPSLLLASNVVAVRLFDAVRHRGSISREPSDLLRQRELIDAVSQRSVPSFPVTVLGL